MATRHLTTFLIDVSPSMREEITVLEDVVVSDEQREAEREAARKAKKAQAKGKAKAEDAMSDDDDGDDSDEEAPPRRPVIRKQERTVSKLQYCMEFVIRKIQQSLVSGKKTNKVNVFLFNSRNTNTILADEGAVGNYSGINELYIPAPPTPSLIEDLLKLKGTRASDAIQGAGDALDALVAAISSVLNKAHSGIDSRMKDSWTRLIYVVTDGRSPLNTADVEQIKEKLVEEAFAVRVMGVGFDTAHEQVPNKPEMVRQNERFWRDFLSGIPKSAVTSAKEALTSSRLPVTFEVAGVGTATTLSIGPPWLNLLARPTHDFFNVPCRVFKYTMQARPMGRKELARLSKPEEPDGGAPGASGGAGAGTGAGAGAAGGAGLGTVSNSADGVAVRIPVMYDFQKAFEQNFMVDGLEPLPENVEKARGYKLGKTVVPLPADLMPIMDASPGLEILNFLKQADFQRQYEVGEVSWVFADQKAGPKAQLQLSALVKGLYERDQYALARYVARKDSAPRLVFLWPECTAEWDCLLLVNACFNDDVRRYTFPSFKRAKTEEGEWVTEHPTLPSAKQTEAMEKLVDAMDLMEEDEDGNPECWYDPYESYSFNVQRVNEVVAHRAVYPDRPVPPPHPALTRFMEPPEFVVERRDALLDELSSVFNTQKIVSTKKARKRDEDEEDQHQPAETDTEEQPKRIKEDPDAPPTAHSSKHAPLADEQHLDLKDPLGDFNKRMDDELEDVVKTLTRLQHTIVRFLHEPFASRNYATAAECIKVARAAFMEQGEEVRWNNFIRSLKREVSRTVGGNPPQPEFWNAHVAGHLDLGLITSAEDTSQQIDISAAQAKEFVAPLENP